LIFFAQPIRKKINEKQKEGLPIRLFDLCPEDRKKAFVASCAFREEDNGNGLEK